jgi:hypothetical protein
LTFFLLSHFRKCITLHKTKKENARKRTRVARKREHPEREKEKDRMPPTFKRPAQRVIDRARSRDDSREPTESTNGEKKQKLNDASDDNDNDDARRATNALADAQPTTNETMLLKNNKKKKMIPKSHVIKESPVNNREVIRDVLQRGKLPLVLDLDSTLVHSVEKTKFLFPSSSADDGEKSGNSNSNGDEEMMRTVKQAQHKIESRLESSPDKFFFVNDQYFTKIRPHARRFLSELSEMYELYIVTAGSQAYAEAIANQVLDPNGKYFNRDVNRIKGMKQWNSEVNQWVDIRTKIVNDALEGAESVTIVVEDKPEMWDGECAVMQVKPYYYFPESFEELKLSHFYNMTDESEKNDSYLVDNILPRLRNVHQMMFQEAVPHFLQNGGSADGEYWPCVADLLSLERKTILRDCYVCLTNVFKIHEVPKDSKIWKEAKNLGATVQETFVDNADIAKRIESIVKDDRTTHVIVGEHGKKNKETGLVFPTSKINQARRNNRPLVSPAWIAESAYLWKPADEKRHEVTNVEMQTAKVKEKKKEPDVKRHARA